jgi:hypothetical protein
LTETLFCLCFTRSVKRRLALLGSNLPRDSRTKEVSCDTSLEDLILQGFFFFLRIPIRLHLRKTLFCHALKNPGVWGGAPARREKILFAQCAAK